MYFLLNKNAYYAMLTETNAVKKTVNKEEATRFESKKEAEKLLRKAHTKLKDFVVIDEKEFEDEVVPVKIKGKDEEEKKNKKTKRRSFTPAERTAVYNRAHGCCEICGKFVPIDAFTIDHIVPISKGGTYDLDNLQLAHESCNLMKIDALPDDFLDKMIEIMKFQGKKNKKIKKKLKKKFA